jgi:hypothetical protein
MENPAVGTEKDICPMSSRCLLPSREYSKIYKNHYDSQYTVRSTKSY